MPLPFSKAGAIEWRSVYELHIPSIDKQHQMLVSIIQQLQEAMLEGRTREIVTPLFAAMNAYTNFHFHFEEEFLKTHEYPQLDSHRAQHAGLVAQLRDLEGKYSAEKVTAGSPLMQFLRTWLIDHIGEHDRAYAAFLKEKRVL